MFADLENEIGAEGDLLLAAETDGFREGLFGGAELAALVELPVIGEIGFDGDPEDAAAIENDSAIEQTGVDLQRGADDEDQVEGGRLASDPLDRAEDPLEEGLLVEEVIVGIGRKPQFRKEGEDGLSRRGLPGEADGLFGIESGYRRPSPSGVQTATRMNPWR